MNVDGGAVTGISISPTSRCAGCSCGGRLTKRCHDQWSKATNLGMGVPWSGSPGKHGPNGLGSSQRASPDDRCHRSACLRNQADGRLPRAAGVFLGGHSRDAHMAPGDVRRGKRSVAPFRIARASRLGALSPDGPLGAGVLAGQHGDVVVRVVEWVFCVLRSAHFGGYGALVVAATPPDHLRGARWAI